MKAADIPDEEFLACVKEYNLGLYPPVVHPARRAVRGFTIPEWIEEGPRWCLAFDLERRFDAPTKVILAKADKLIRRGLLDGCACGCRGDFEIPGLM